MEAAIREKVRCQSNTVRICLAEAFGTFVLCLVGNGATHENALLNNGPLAVPLTYGLGLAFGIYVCAGVSGGHVNPAVSLAMALLGRLGDTAVENFKMFLLYSLSQIVGAFLSSFVVFGVYTEAETHLNLTAAQNTGFYATFPAGVYEASQGALFFDQIIATWILLTVIFAVTDNRNTNPGGLAPLLIGLAAVGIALSYGTGGGAINPARDLGPRIFAAIMYGADAFTHANHFFWIPLIGPLFGGVLSALCYLLFISAHWPEEAEKATTNGGQEYQPVEKEGVEDTALVETTTE